MKLAIIGSRDMTDKALFAKGITDAIEKWGKPILVVSGGARGADTLGEQWAKDNDIECTVYKPDWNRYGKSAGLRRNKDIINACDCVLAFPSNGGSGTQHSIGLAKKANIPTIVYYID